MLHKDITEKILGAAVTVHQALGPGLAEHSYQAAMAMELSEVGLAFEREPILLARFKGAVVGRHRPDFIVAAAVILELKCANGLEPVFTTQVLTYLRLSGLKVGLLVNFNVPAIGYGIKRIVL